MSSEIEVMELDEDGNVVESWTVKGVTPEEAEGETFSAGYESFADLYVDAEQQAEESEEPGDDEDEY